MTKVFIQTPEIRLDALLKFSGLCDTGGQAKILIQDGLVLLNGATCEQRTKKIVAGDVVEYDGRAIEVACR